MKLTADRAATRSGSCQSLTVQVSHLIPTQPAYIAEAAKMGISASVTAPMTGYESVGSMHRCFPEYTTRVAASEP